MFASFQKVFFLTWKPARGVPPISRVQRLSDPFHLFFFALLSPTHCRSHASRTDWLLENQVFWLLSKWVLAAFLGTWRKFPQSLDCFLPELPFIGLAYQGKDIVFRFIIECSSVRDFGPYVIDLFWYEGFWKMIFWLVLKLEISYRVNISWRILVYFRGFFFEDYLFSWWNIWVFKFLLLH
jgi:hypothetical protein